jgi:hypothetical protein
MYIIGNLYFKTQKEASLYCRELFKKNGYGVANEITHVFLMELLKRHPQYEEKVGIGIDFFTINKNQYSRHDCVYLTFTRIDGSVDDFSYIMCIKGKDLTLKQQTVSAMRNSIRNDISFFKLNAEQKCNRCGIDNVDFDCDHYGIEFKELSEGFIKKNGVCNSFGKEECFICFGDIQYNKKWVEYHNTLAKLQLLCISCHKKKKTTFPHS